MFNDFEELDKLIKKSQVVWASNGKKLTQKDWDSFKEHHFKNPIDYIMEGFNFPVAEELYLKNLDNPYWLP